MSDTKEIVLIVGLGNPGRQYEYSRHNLGFLAVDFFLESHDVRWGKKYESEFTKVSINGVDRTFVKPQTFMNLSGKAVRSFIQFYKIEPTQMIVIHDEADLEEGDVRLKKGGGAGGHNGLLSIFSDAGIQDFYRIRVGVGKSPSKELADFLLEKTSKNKLLDLAEKSSQLLQAVFDHGFVKAQNHYNAKKSVDS